MLVIINVYNFKFVIVGIELSINSKNFEISDIIKSSWH